MVYNVQNISFSIPDNEREENFGLKEWAGNKMLDAMLAAAKNRVGNINLGDIAGRVLGGDVTPLQDLYDKFMNGNKTESTTPENNTGTSSNSLWTGIADFIKNHPYLSAGGAALAGNILSNAMRRPQYSMPMQMPNYGMGYGMPMPMPVYQPMMPSYGYYGNGLSNAITSLAPILTAYGINRLVNSQNKPVAIQPQPTEPPKNKNEGIQNPDEYARELMEQFPDHYDEIQKSLDSLEEKYKDDWNKINTGLKATAIKLGKAANQSNPQTQPAEDSSDDKVRRGFTRVDGDWLLNQKIKRSEKKYNRLVAGRSEEEKQRMDNELLEAQERTRKSMPEIVDQYYEQYGDHRRPKIVDWGSNVLGSVNDAAARLYIAGGNTLHRLGEKAKQTVLGRAAN